jgi:hypothetical protein
VTEVPFTVAFTESFDELIVVDEAGGEDPVVIAPWEACVTDI